MIAPKHTQIQIPINSQIDTLKSLADRVLASFESGDSTNINANVRNLTYLSNELSKVSKKIAAYEAEHENLIALAEVGQLVNSSLELNKVLRYVMDTIIRLTHAERGFLMLLDDDGEMKIQIARNWEQESIDPTESEISHTIIDRVIREEQPIITTNAQEDPRFESQHSVITFNLRSILCVPLKVKDKIIGVIYTDNRIRTGLFNETQKDLLNNFSNQAAIAIDNPRLFESVRQTLEEVTELKNLMDNVFASIASGVITTDIENNIILCNKAAERILGMAQTDLVGISLGDGLPGLFQHLETKMDEVWRNDQQIIGEEVKLVQNQNDRLDLSFNISPLKDAMSLTQGVALVIDDLTEKKRLEAQKSMFKRMVSPAVIDYLDPEKMHLGGTQAMVTTLFADIRGFTKFSERRSPEELVNILNRYLSDTVQVVLDQEGTIDKFLGDAIMAWFNHPIPQSDHALRAVRAALHMRQAIHNLHNQLDPKFHLSFGVGIHFGEAVMGLIGTETRMDYTAIGDSVNTAKRIQENTAANQILISASAFEHVRDQIRVKASEPIYAKGKEKPVQVFEVMDLI